MQVRSAQGRDKSALALLWRKRVAMQFVGECAKVISRPGRGVYAKAP